MAECHSIKLSSAGREVKAKAPGGARAAAGSGVTAVCHRASVKEQIRRLFSVPAKCITPYTEAELALIAQKRDKKAEDEFLTRTLETARSNCHIYCYLADLG